MENEVLFAVSGPDLYAEVRSNGKGFAVRVLDDLDELLETIHVDGDESEALKIAYNATVGKGL